MKAQPGRAAPAGADAVVNKARRDQSTAPAGSRRQQEPAVGVDVQQVEAWGTYNRRCKRCLAAAAVVLVAAFFLNSSRAPDSWQGSKSSSSVGAGSYLRQIAEVHDWKQAAADAVQLGQDLHHSLTACAKQLVLPEVKVPQHIPRPAWYPSTSSLPEIAALDLNCSHPAHADACAQAAASNSYEGGSSVLTATDLAELLRVRTRTTHAAAPDPLASLHLNCVQDPAACAEVAASTNAYEGSRGGAADPAAAAEAAAYLTAASPGMSHAAWSAVIGSGRPDTSEHGLEQLRRLTNSYEGVEAASWQYRRLAEEAGAHYLDVSALDLDCSPAAVSSDPHTRLECRRSRAVNKYESSLGSPQQAAAAAGSADGDAGDAATAWAAVSADTRVELGRSYYKSACNSPAARELYKSPGSQQRDASRRYYKNAANAPAPLNAVLPQPPQGGKAPRSATSTSTLSEVLQSARLWATLVVLLLTCWFLDDLAAIGSPWLLTAFAAVGCWCSKLPGRFRRRPAVPRTLSGVALVPFASQELPAPQLMALEPPGLLAAPAANGAAGGCASLPTQPARFQSLDVPVVSATAAAEAQAPASPEAASPAGALGGAQGTQVGSLGVDSSAVDSGQAAAPAGAAVRTCPLPGLLQLPEGDDDVEAGTCDSPRARARVGHSRRSMTPLMSGRERPGTTLSKPS